MKSRGREAALACFSLWAWPTAIVDACAGVAACHAVAPVIGREAAFERGLHAWMRLHLALGGYRVAVEGFERVPRPAVLIANHQHWFDVPLLAAVVPPPVRFVATSEALRVPILGHVLRHGGHVIVRAGAPNGNVSELLRARELLRAGHRVVLFPEGRRSRDGVVRRFHAGAVVLAARAGCPLVPVALAGTRAAAPDVRLVPSRLAVSFLTPRAVRTSDVRSPALLDDIAADVAREVGRLEPTTGPLI